MNHRGDVASDVIAIEADVERAELGALPLDLCNGVGEPVCQGLPSPDNADKGEVL